MSRMTLCLLTAAVLAVLSIGIMATRYAVLGNEVKTPAGPSTWKVTLVVNGQSEGEPHVVTAAPLDMGHQHVLKEEFTSQQFLPKPSDVKRPTRRSVVWTHRAGQGDGTFRVRCEHFVSLDVAHPSPAMTEAAKGLYAAPEAAEHLDRTVRNAADVELLEGKARSLTEGLSDRAAMAETLYGFVQHEVKNDPSTGGLAVVAADCLRNESGDAAAKARLLTALLRHRGIPARLVNGLTLHRVAEQCADFWVEAWLGDRWVPMDSSHGLQYGKLPGAYLVFAVGDAPLVRGKNIKDLSYAFLVEHATINDLDGGQASACKRFSGATALSLLPPAEQKLVEFLLLLPIAALVICVFRNLIGIISFGTFGPALVGLAFRDVHNLGGILVFMSILLVGWAMRHVLGYYNLLQVPRIAVMLSLIVVVLIFAVFLANRYDLPATKYFSLFPMIILTGMVERFWTLETEDSTVSSFRTLLYTMVIAATVALVTSSHALAHHLFCYPELILLVIAAQLLIGRYTGYRLMELFRFRDFVTGPPKLSVVSE